MKQGKIKTGTVGRDRLIPFENYMSLEGIVRFELQGRVAAAYLLKQGDGQNRSWQFIFPFQLDGIHTTLSDEGYDNLLETISGALKDFPESEKITFHFTSFTDDFARQQELAELCDENDDNQAIQYLLTSERKRIQELTISGARKPKSLVCYCSYTANNVSANTGDWIEKILATGEFYWNKFTGSQESLESLALDKIFHSAFTDGFKMWELLLNKMKLGVKPLEEEDLWALLYSRFNPGRVPPLSQLIVFTEAGIQEYSESDKHLTTLVLPQASSVPFADRSYIHIKNKYVGVLVWDDKPSGWSSPEGQLKYLWEIFARDPVYDTECFCQITRAQPTLVKDSVERLTKQATAARKFSEKRSNVDVGANLRQRQAIEAQEQLLTGELPLYVSMVFLVHRDSPAQLDSDCRYLQNTVVRPAWLNREQEYAWQVFLDTLPTTWSRMLYSPFDRRLLYLNGEVPAFMGLVRPNNVDEGGFELLSEEGGVPIHLNPFEQHRNIALFATTRGGKSVLTAGILTHALARDIPVIVMDFPPTDSASTFKTWSITCSGAYFDIGKEANNLLEPPDLRKFQGEAAVERMLEFQEFVVSALMVMIFGSSGSTISTEEKLQRQSIRSLVYLSVDSFFKDAQIVNRIQLAQNDGIGSMAWANFPTLKDYLGYFLELSDQNREENAADPYREKAISQIKRQLEFWLSSRVGQAISRPSTFRSDVKLLVFALRGLSDGDDAAVLALAAYSAALKRALTHNESVFFIDEFSVLLEWPEIGALIARLAANGAKAGIRVFLAAQDPNTLANSASGPKILQNINVRLIGRIQPNAAKSFINILGVDEKIIGENASERFYPSASGLYSKWLLEIDGKRTFVRYYSSPLSLAIVANNPRESEARQKYMEAYSTPWEGLVAFSHELASALRDGRREFRLPNPPRDRDKEVSRPRVLVS